MAKFFTNVAGTLAIKLDQVKLVYIEENKGVFTLKVKTDWAEAETIETADSLAEAQQKAAPLMAALEQ